MHQNQPGTYTNQLSSHASLLLSASPTIVTSPLQNNTNNQPQTSPQSATIALIRRQPSTPLLPASNLDNDSHSNTGSPTNSTLPEGYINFKKPQNEIFKKLDGKIQKIVAAHSNLNKLYALNDFSGGAGPRRPFELPAQLPPPPPWVPKVSVELNGPWPEDTPNPSATSPDALPISPISDARPGPSILNASSRLKMNKERPINPIGIKSPNLTIDSAITKLHQRRQQQMRPEKQFNQSHTHPNPVSPSLKRLNNSPTTPGPSTLTVTARQTPTITPAQFALLTQKIRETFEKRCTSNNDRSQSMSEGDRREYKDHLIALLKDEIAAVAKTANLTNNLTANAPKPNNRLEQKSSLMKSNPQALFNTIRRETSILLRKRDHPTRPNPTIPVDYQPYASHNSQDSTARLPLAKIPHTIKVIVPPTECQLVSKSISDKSREARKSICDSAKVQVEVDGKLSYQVIKNKIRSFQEVHQIYIGRGDTSSVQYANNFKKRKSTQKSLDKIVDRLQAKCTPSPTDVKPQVSGIQRLPTLQQQIINSSAHLLQASKAVSSTSAPTPIPVFRSPLLNAPKGSISYCAQSGVSKVINNKSKKGKRLHHFGLKLGNYLDKECPQPSVDKITIEQYARCLNLVRSNDISLQRHQEQLHSDNGWKIPTSNRPLRLRRIRGERIHMPASASYRATRKVGLQ